MTCVIGYIDKAKNKLYIGADSMMSTENMKMYVNIDNQKVFQNGEFTFGVCGSPRMMSLLRYSLLVPERTIHQLDTDYMNTDFIESVRNLFISSGFGGLDANNTQTGGVFLVGYNGKIYRVDSDYQVLLIDDDYISIGSGCEYALGALSALEHTKMKTADKVELALLCSARYNPFVGGNNYIMEVPT